MDYNSSNQNPRKAHFTSISDVLKKYKTDDTDKYVSREFQKYGYDLAQELGDPKNVSLYIKLAKDNPRGIMESVRSFVSDAQNVKSRPALFLWKLTKLKKEIKEKSEKLKDEVKQ